jgi:hypothetical protein
MKNAKRILYASLRLILRGFPPFRFFVSLPPFPRYYIGLHKKDMRMLIKFNYDPQPGIGCTTPWPIPCKTLPNAPNGQCSH